MSLELRSAWANSGSKLANVCLLVSLLDDPAGDYTDTAIVTASGRLFSCDQPGLIQDSFSICMCACVRICNEYMHILAKLAC